MLLFSNPLRTREYSECSINKNYHEDYCFLIWMTKMNTFSLFTFHANNKTLFGAYRWETKNYLSKKRTQCIPLFDSKITIAVFDERLSSLNHTSVSTPRLFFCCNFMLLVALFFKLELDIKPENVYNNQFIFLENCSFFLR